MKFKQKREIVLILITAIICFGIGYFTSLKVNNIVPINQTDIKTIDESNVATSIENSPIVSKQLDVNINSIESNPVDSIATKRLSNANKKFELTMRNCLGTFCFDEAVNEIDRIGVLSPYFSGGDIITKFLKKHSSDLSKIDLIYDSNVPAYGYGKNHGWTRIIRIVRPIIPFSKDLTKSLSSNALSAQVFAVL